MLIYNSQKEFLGIDEADLEVLGFKNLSELRAEAADFADLFVKTPGFIHNFKHVHWIDFITCADSSETPKAIIHANEKSYRCDVNISIAYLTDDPSAQAYLVNLQNIRTLTKSENSDISQDVLVKPAPETITIEDPALTQKQEPETIRTTEPTPDIKMDESIDDIYDTSSEIENNLHESIEKTHIIEDNYDNTLLEAPLDIDLDDDFKLINEPEIEEPLNQEVPKKIIIEELTTEDEDGYDKSYQFDPQIASDELGLPIDLIEEFIEDFVAQAHDFKDDLYQSVNDGDIDNVHILSHKLKGVAANLRVEDAFQVLSTINTSQDINVIEKNLKYLYLIIAKLSGEESSTEAIQASVEEEESEDDFVLEFKEIDNIQADPVEIEAIEDSNIPLKIDIPELADDNFIDDETIQKIEIDEKSLAVDIETFDETELSKEVLEIDELPDILEIEEVLPKEEIALELLQELDVPQEELQEESTYNKVEVANEIGLDQDSFNELLQDYIDDSNELCNSIRDAIASKNSDVWKKETLKLKGMSKNMRIDTFSSEIETLLTTTDQEIAQNAIKTVNNQITKISNSRD